MKVCKHTRRGGICIRRCIIRLSAQQPCVCRSIYIGNVDYACTPEELQQHFQQCGTVNRVTILTDKMGNAKVCYHRLEPHQPGVQCGCRPGMWVCP